MSALVTPDVRFHPSWAESVAEYTADGTVMHGSGLWEFEPLDTTAEFFPTIVDTLVSHGNGTANLPDGIVPSSYFWIAEGDEFVGYLALRHSLTEWLLNEGGHIGFSVRPSRRRQGYAGRALAASLPYAAALGLERVLLTCDEDNHGSRRTIEGNGGVYEDSRNGKRRYWIDTGSSPTVQ